MNAALLVIDCQNDFVKGASPYSCEMMDDARINNIKALIDFCRKKGMRIIYTQHSIRQDKSNAEQGEPNDIMACIIGSKGWKIVEALRPKSSDVIVRKDRADAFFMTEMDKELKKLNTDTLVICGVLTNNCVRATSEAAYARNYKIILVEDCCGATSFVDGMTSKEINELTLKELKERTYRTELVKLKQLEKILH